MVEDAGSGLAVTQLLRRGGFGYLRSRMRSFCELARHMPVLLLTDLDAEECPATLIEDWSRRDAIPEQLLFRVAVRQVESWLLADRDGMARLLKVSVRQLPPDPDALPDAKRSLLQLAQRAPRAIREDLVAETGATASQGLGYNSVLSNFVRTSWDPSQAVHRSNSLARAYVGERTVGNGLIGRDIMTSPKSLIINSPYDPPSRRCRKRLRYFLQRDPEALGAVLHILLRVIEARLRQRSGCARGRLGAVSLCSSALAAR